MTRFSHYLPTLRATFLVAALASALWVHAAPLTPDKDITVVTGEQQIPQWKQLWDEARARARKQDTEGAVERYLGVLEIKPYIEDVKWELSKSYMELEQYDKALILLESLLEASPDQIEYLVSAGEAALQQQKAGIATAYFGEALALAPSGPFSEAALVGMVAALSAQGKKEFSIPLMEQLYQRGAIGPELLLDLARFYAGQQDFDRGSFYYQELIEKYPIEDTVSAEAATAFERSGDFERAAVQWEAYLEKHPDYLEFHTKLAEYYQNTGQFPDALIHILYLLEHDVDRERYLLETARIYLYELGRSDRALFYFEQYQKEYPLGVDVSEEIAGLQMILANDLIAIIENDGVWMLWRDLAEVTPDRVGIYRAMADMLREKGREKEDELIEILKIINTHEPADIDIIAQLVHLYRKTGRIGECSEFFERAAAGEKNQATLHLLHSQCQLSAGDDLGRLKSYTAYLQLRPDDEEIRIEALRLAGALGLVEQLDRLHRGGATANVGQMSDVDLVYADALLKNGLSRSAETFIATFADPSALDAHAFLSRELSSLDLRQNRPYKAEQLGRTFAARNPERVDGLLLLADLFIKKRDIPIARFWHDRIKKNGVTLSRAQESELFYQKLLIDRALSKVDVYQRAVQYLNTQLKQNKIVAEDVDVLLFGAEHYFITNRFDDCIRLINRFRPKFKGVDRVGALLTLARTERPGRNLPWPDRFENVSLSVRIAVAEELVGMGRLSDAEDVLTDIAAELPDSIRTKYLLAEVYLSLLAYEKAEDVYAGLAQAFQDETYFMEQRFRIENLRGDPQSIFQEFSVAVDESGRKHAIQSQHRLLDYPEIKLMWARSLWSADKWEESLDVYGLLDTAMKRELDSMKQDLEELARDEHLSAGLRDGTEMNFDERATIDLIMSKEFVADNLTSGITRISSGYYDSYRWGTIVDKEMTAKSSLKAKEFYQAEIDYQKLFQEEASVAEYSYPDLATVYSRLGRYQEETVLVEKIKETNLSSPDLNRITEKNLRRRQPFLFVEGSYLEEDGYDGSIDISETYSAIGLQVKPTLYQDVGLVVGYSEYGNSSGSGLTDSTTLLGNYSIQFSDTIEANGKLGFEDFAEDGDDFFLYELSARGTLEQRVEVYGGVKQEPVDDTIESLLSNISRRDIVIGFSLDYFFGMFFGFDIDFYDYSDDNEGERYYLWSSYRWFGDRSGIDISYSYTNLQHELTNEIAADDPGIPDLPYWSPGDYWKHRLSGTYKMELWPTGRLQTGTGSFSVMYGLGYEKGDSLIHEIDMNILLEITTSFLVKGSFSTVLSDDHDLLKGMVSLVYRW